MCLIISVSSTNMSGNTNTASLRTNEVNKQCDTVTLRVQKLGRKKNQRLFVGTRPPCSPPRPPSAAVWGQPSSRCRGHLSRGFDRAYIALDMALATHRARFHKLPNRKLSRKKTETKTGSVPTSGLEPWLIRGGGVEESRSHTRSDCCIALERQKKVQKPRGGLVAVSLSVCRSTLFVEISVALA